MYKRLRQLKDIYKGQRVFLCGNGPSLTLGDLELLKNEHVCMMNTAISQYGNLSYVPEIYGFMDGTVMERIGKDIVNCPSQYIFFTRNEDTSRVRYKKTKPLFDELAENCHSYELHQMKSGSWLYFCKRLPKGFSLDISKRAYWGYTITYTMLQILIYMGFEEIYLLGMDCSYMPGVKCFADIRSKKEIEKGDEDGRPINNFLKAYEVAKKYAERENVKIINATRGGMLESFPRVDLEEVLNN